MTVRSRLVMLIFLPVIVPIFMLGWVMNVIGEKRRPYKKPVETPVKLEVAAPLEVEA